MALYFFVPIKIRSLPKILQTKWPLPESTNHRRRRFGGKHRYAARSSTFTAHFTQLWRENQTIEAYAHQTGHFNGTYSS